MGRITKYKWLFIVLTLSIAFGGVAYAGLVEDNASIPWVRAYPASSPSPRGGMPMVYDPVRDESILFGGVGAGNDTWVWDGSNWAQRFPINAPSPRNYAAMAFDGDHSETVLFGGLGGSHFSDTWTWDGTDWTRHYPAHSPSARRWASMAFDATRHEVVLFGGVGGGNDTWTWDGTDWTQRNPSQSPPARDGGSMAYDSENSNVVLFGGDSSSSDEDTWTWDGTDWTKHSPIHSPQPRGYAEMVWDGSRNHIVMFGGKDYSSGPQVFNDTWAWDGADWAPMVPSTSPPASGYGAMAYQSSSRQIVLFGGYEGAGSNQTWLLSGPTQIVARPAIVAHSKEVDGNTNATIERCKLYDETNTLITDPEIGCEVSSASFQISGPGDDIVVEGVGIHLTGANSNTYRLSASSASTTASIFQHGIAFGIGSYSTPASPPNIRYSFRAPSAGRNGVLVWNSWRHFKYRAAATNYVRTQCPDTSFAQVGGTKCGTLTGAGTLYIWDRVTGHWTLAGAAVPFTATFGDGGRGASDFFSVDLPTAIASGETSSPQRLSIGNNQVRLR